MRPDLRRHSSRAPQALLTPEEARLPTYKMWLRTLPLANPFATDTPGSRSTHSDQVFLLCRRGDLNPHALAGTSPSSWRVCQFRHSDVAIRTSRMRSAIVAGGPQGATRATRVPGGPLSPRDGPSAGPVCRRPDVAGR